MTQEQPLQRMDQSLNKISEPTLLVLKIHLLVEENLFAAVQRKLPNPQFLQEANPRFAQLLSIAKAFFYKENDREIWEAIRALNTLRNRLAHRLEPGDISSLLREISCIVPLSDDFSLEDPSASSVLNHNAGFLIGFTSSLGTAAT